MLPNSLLRSFRPESLRKSRANHLNDETEQPGMQFHYSIPFNIQPIKNQTKFSLRTENSSHRPKIFKKMANKLSNFSDLIQRVTASCLLHPLSTTRLEFDDQDEESEEEQVYKSEDEDEEKDREEPFMRAEVRNHNSRVPELEMLIGEVFEAVSGMKRAYVSLQEAHCPWDPDKMRVADVAVVGELRRLGVLGERFRRSVGGECGGGFRVGAATLREVVAPYEAAVEDLKREVKAKEVEVENLKDKLKTAVEAASGGGGKRGKSNHNHHHQSKRRVSCISQVQVAPAPELFEATMSSVKQASKAFTSLLLSLMRSAHWDIAAAVRSIETASSTTTSTNSIVGVNHAKYAFESYVNHKIFQGFDHETFYMDGSLSSLLNPDQYRLDCFTQYRDMKAMDPIELLGILPTCSFGKFCSNKYLNIVHPKMEESLFGDLEQRRQVLNGSHPRSQFYGEFLRLAKAVWLLHLLAFSLDPPPSHFEASKGAEFHPQYMESVLKFSGGRVVVGFPVSPGFKLGNGSVIRARVYVVART